MSIYIFHTIATTLINNPYIFNHSGTSGTKFSLDSEQEKFITRDEIPIFRARMYGSKLVKKNALIVRCVFDVKSEENQNKICEAFPDEMIGKCLYEAFSRDRLSNDVYEDHKVLLDTFLPKYLIYMLLADSSKKQIIKDKMVELNIDAIEEDISIMHRVNRIHAKPLPLYYREDIIDLYKQYNRILETEYYYYWVCICVSNYVYSAIILYYDENGKIINNKRLTVNLKYPDICSTKSLKEIAILEITKNEQLINQMDLENYPKELKEETQLEVIKSKMLPDKQTEAAKDKQIEDQIKREEAQIKYLLALVQAEINKDLNID